MVDTGEKLAPSHERRVAKKKKIANEDFQQTCRVFSLQSRHIFLDFRLTESWGESKKDSKGEVDMSKEGRGRGRGRGGKTLHSLNIPLNASLNILLNRPGYQYSGHIELIRFKEYSRMPRGHEHISFVF